MRIELFDLHVPREFIRFSKIQQNCLNLLNNAFGNRYFGDDIYLSKINSRNLIFIIAFNSNDKPVGLLIKKESGKMSGLAVLKAYRKKRIASTLIDFLRRNEKYIFGEVAIGNRVMINLMKKLNFRLLGSKPKIKELLSDNGDISFLDEKRNYITYYHSADKKQIPKMKKFVIYYFDSKTQTTTNRSVTHELNLHNHA